MKFDLVLTQKELEKHKEGALKLMAIKTTLKGFRPGKAPLNKVAEYVGEKAIIERAIDSALSKLYQEEIKTKNLKPISSPKITPKNLEPDKDWTFEVEIAETPEVKLNKYQDAIKSSAAKSKIWTPDKAAKADEETKHSHDHNHDHDNTDKKLDLIFQALLETCSVEVPSLLVDEEINRMLSRLVDQVSKLGMTTADYLKARGTTQEQMRQDYAKSATDSLKLEFILQAIALDQKIEVPKTELDQIIDGAKDPGSAKQLKTDQGRLNLYLYLLRQKTLSCLLSLAV